MSHLLPHGYLVARTLTGNTTVAADDEVLFCDASGGSFTVTLPAANLGVRRIEIKRIDSALANAVTVARAGSDLFDTLETAIPLLVASGVLRLVSDGVSRWEVM